MNSEEKVALHEVVDEYLQGEERKQKSKTIKSYGITFPQVFTREEYQKLQFSKWPLRVLDVDRLMEDPSPKRLKACITTPTDRFLFVGRRDGKVITRFSVEKVNGKWEQGFLRIPLNFNFVRRYAILDSITALADENKFYVLDCMGHPWVMCNVKGEPRFYLGKHGMDAHAFIEAVTSIYNRRESAKKWAREQEEMKKGK